MQIDYTKRFKKQFSKLQLTQKNQFNNRVQLFIKNQADPILRVHPLKGRFAGYYSMNISGDLRALFYKEGEELVIFALIGTHSQLYG